MPSHFAANYFAQYPLDGVPAALRCCDSAVSPPLLLMLVQGVLSGSAHCCRNVFRNGKLSKRGSTLSAVTTSNFRADINVAWHWYTINGDDNARGREAGGPLEAFGNLRGTHLNFRIGDKNDGALRLSD